MSDVRADGDPDALPWLEGVEDEDNPPAVSARKMLAALLLVLVGVAMVAGTLFWLGRQDKGSGPPQLIRAEPGPYKVRPDDPGGLDVAGDSGTAYATGAGEDSDAVLDVSRLNDRPLPPPADGPEAGKPAAPPAPKPAPPPAPTGAKGTVIQLGAYGSTAKAETAWRLLSGRFPAVAGLTKMVVPYSGGYRLRASAGSPAEAQAACRAVTAGGENCFVAQ
jgi:sporulation related protein